MSHHGHSHIVRTSIGTNKIILAKNFLSTPYTSPWPSLPINELGAFIYEDENTLPPTKSEFRPRSGGNTPSPISNYLFPDHKYRRWNEMHMDGTNDFHNYLSKLTDFFQTYLSKFVVLVTKFLRAIVYYHYSPEFKSWWTSIGTYMEFSSLSRFPKLILSKHLIFQNHFPLRIV